MKIIYLLLSALVVCSSLSGKIIETAHFNEIVQHVTPQTLVILDIDDTLLIPSQTLGTDVWFLYRINQLKNDGTVHAKALEKAVAEWEAIRQITTVKLVEEGTERIIQGLQEQHVKVIGLTTQGLALATCTINQLQFLHIDLSKTAPSKEDHYFINRLGVLYRQGILFTSGTSKGEALFKLLDLIRYYPERVVFINDKATHLQDVEASAQAKGIEFIGLRYSASDQRIKDFHPQIADIQWTHSTFGHLLSDAEAEQLSHKQ